MNLPKVSKVPLKGNQFTLALKFDHKPGSIRISNKGMVIKEYKKIDNDFSVSFELKKGRNEVDVWGDNDLIISYKTK